MSKSIERTSSLGLDNFAERYGLSSIERDAQVKEIIGRAKADGVKMIRVSFADQHGILRGKTIVVEELESIFNNGCSAVAALLLKDTSHLSVFPVFSTDGGLGMEEMGGGGDMLILPDPSTYRNLPWADGNAWVQGDLYFTNGKPVLFSTRRLLQNTLGDLAELGYGLRSGLELEFHLYNLTDPMLGLESGGAMDRPADPPQVSLSTHGYAYNTEIRFDQLEPFFDLLRSTCLEMGLPIRTMEIEFGPSQCEVTFSPGTGTETADWMVLFRNIVKQLARRQGMHATFMALPNFPNTMASGWHLHQSLYDINTGKSVMIPETEDSPLSEVGKQFAAGLLEHAVASSLFATPTINGYRRRKAFSLAPDRVTWSSDNRAAMLRVISAVGDSTSRVENRIGDPAANPYLFMAAQIAAGTHGIKNQSVPPEMSDTPYESDAPILPSNILEAIAALNSDEFYKEVFGEGFVNYFVHMKQAEAGRFMDTVTEWEHREYFELF